MKKNALLKKSSNKHTPRKC